MNGKAVKRLFETHRIGRWLITAVIFLGIFILLLISLALISGGLITVPAAAARIIGAERFFVSDMPPYTMFFAGGFMLLSGAALILFTAGRLCPASAEYILRIYGDGDRK